MEIRKKSLMVRAVWGQNRLSREIMASPFLEIFKQMLNQHLLERL